MDATVIETKTGWMIRCRACNWHEFPKVGKPGASWTFDGDMEHPTFTPSMNELVNGPGEHHNAELPTRRCHFIVTRGQINYCGDCTHDLAGQSVPLDVWPETDIEHHRLMKELDQW